MRFGSLQEWLSWQESLNPKEIDLGLERVARVLQQLQIPADFSCPVITVAGTNGKGSTVAFIESILTAAGHSVGCYTSPHLFSYNERIRVNRQPVDDASLCKAFETVDQARDDVPLTYFEFGTLAALQIFDQLKLDVVVLEVGLGGRLDAVNVINPDVAVISSIDIDHIDWLGSDVQDIAREKSGIMRTQRPCVVSMINPPASLLDYAQALQTPLIRLARDYLYQRLPQGGWQLRSDTLYLSDLPAPALKGGFQLQNAAAAIMAIDALTMLPTPSAEQIGDGLKQVQLAGRYQQLHSHPQLIVDVAHNAESARALAEMLRDDPADRTLAVIAMLADKAVKEVISIVGPEVEHWITAGLDVPRGLAAKNMAEAVRGLQADDKLSACNTVTQACEQAMKMASPNDRVIVFGSFYTVSEAMQFFNTLFKSDSLEQ